MPKNKRCPEARQGRENIEFVAAVENVTSGNVPLDVGQITLIIQQALSPLVSKIQEMEKQREAMPVVTTTREESAARNVLQLVEMMPTQEKPTFSGGTQNPIAFLEDLKDYIKRTKRTDTMMVVKESLKIGAKSWMKLYSKRWNNMEDFERDFIANYWGDICQKNMRRRLSDAVWEPKRGTTMLGHFAKYWELAKALKITDTPLGVINEIMRHFPKETQALWFSREQGDELDAAEFLRKLDNMVCAPQDKNTDKRGRDGRQENFRDRRHAIRPKVGVIEGTSQSAGCKTCSGAKVQAAVINNTTPMSGKEICRTEDAGNDNESVQEL